MSIVVEETAHVLAEPHHVWRLLSEPTAWPRWWTGCVAAKLIDGSRFDEGARLELVVQPKHLKTTYRPLVDMMTRERVLSLTHRGPFRQATVTWTLTPEDERVRVTARGVFQGAYFFFLRVLQKGSTPERVLKVQLRELRRTAERLAADG